jgi:hypothetical protein
MYVICLSESGLFHLTWWSPFPFSWKSYNSILLYGCIILHHVYIPHFFTNFYMALKSRKHVEFCRLCFFFNWDKHVFSSSFYWCHVLNWFLHSMNQFHLVMLHNPCNFLVFAANICTHDYKWCWSVVLFWCLFVFGIRECLPHRMKPELLPPLLFLLNFQGLMSAAS